MTRGIGDAPGLGRDVRPRSRGSREQCRLAEKRKSITGSHLGFPGSAASGGVAVNTPSICLGETSVMMVRYYTIDGC